MLQTAYKAAGVPYDGGLDRQIYNVESALQEIGQYAHAAFVQGGSINTFASKMAKLAALEGHEFDKTPDEAGLTEAMYRGAGLKVPT